MPRSRPSVPSRRYPCPRDCGHLTTRPRYPCCRHCVWHQTQAPGFPRHTDFCERETAEALRVLQPRLVAHPFAADLPLPRVLVHLLAPHFQGLRAGELRQAILPPPAYNTVLSALRRLCQHHIVVRVAPGRYTLTNAFRTSGLVDALSSSSGGADV
jgi:hypothetical protein